MNPLKELCVWTLGSVLVAASAHAGVVVEFNAATAGVGVDPTGVAPAWTRSSSDGAGMINNGTYLLQDDTALGGQQYREYLSPSAGAGFMTRGGAPYGIEFRVRPLTDVAFIGSHWPESYLTWSDDQFNYNITIDQFSAATSSGTGDIVYGRNSFSPAITGINWSTPHTIFIGHRGSGGSSVFDFYLDGNIVSTVTDGSIARSGSYARDQVGFGDGTTGGNDVASEWYFVRIHDTNVPVPEPTSLILLGLALPVVRRSFVKR